MFGRKNPPARTARLPSPKASDSLSRKGSALHGYSTAAGRRKTSCGRVPVFHRIPLFSRTRIACSAPEERSRASATKPENDSIIRLILSLLPDFVKTYPGGIFAQKALFLANRGFAGKRKGKEWESILHGCFLHRCTDGGEYADGAAQKQNGHTGQQQIGVLVAVHSGAGQIVGEVGLGSGYNGGNH